MSFRIDWPARGHAYTEEEIEAVVAVLRNKTAPLSQAGNVEAFEKEFATYIRAEHCYATMSCAHSLDISAMLLEIGPGDEVILPAHTYCATALAFLRRGAALRWADIDPHHWTLSPESIEALITEKTRAIVLVHLYGLLSPHVEEIADLARGRGVPLVEDCAQSLGARHGARHCGTFGDIGVYSFHSQKNLTTFGEGGMITVRNEKLGQKVKGLRLNGHAPFPDRDSYWIPAMVNVDQDIPGVWPMKSTMSEAQAAIGRKVLTRLDTLTDSRRRRGVEAREKLGSIENLTFQKIARSEGHSHHLLPMVCESNAYRNALIKLLSERFGIKAIAQYYPLNRYDLFKKNGLGEASVPVSDRVYDRQVSLPFSLIISDEDFNYMLESIEEAVQLIGNG